jgi:membrane-bound serine protease (ClpP class)
MEIVIVIAAVGAGLMLLELLTPTGGVLAVLGALGLVVSGVVAIATDADVADYVGPSLIALGVLAAVAFFVITPKILKAQRDRVHTGWEELVGREAHVRSRLDPVGQIWVEGALWKARVGDGEPPADVGVRVLIEAVDGLTLLVRPVAAAERGDQPEGTPER